MTSFFEECIAGFQPANLPADLKLLQRFLTVLEQRYKEEGRKPLVYAEQLKVSPEKLNALCRFYFNTTVYGMLQYRIHQEALKLLQFTNMNVKQISYELGVCSPNYFCKCFKEIEKLTPLNYRKKMIGTKNIRWPHGSGDAENL